MSITYLIVLMFLCISLHACNARHFSTIDKKLEKKKSNFSVNLKINDEKKVSDSTPNQLNNEGNNGHKIMKTHLVKSNHSDDEKPIKNRRTRSMVKSSSSSASSQRESLVSISWRVPHKKKPREKNPGFNLDYSPPKTHPPSHN